MELPQTGIRRVTRRHIRKATRSVHRQRACDCTTPTPTPTHQARTHTHTHTHTRTHTHGTRPKQGPRRAKLYKRQTRPWAASTEITHGRVISLVISLVGARAFGRERRKRSFPALSSEQLPAKVAPREHISPDPCRACGRPAVPHPHARAWGGEGRATGPGRAGQGGRRGQAVPPGGRVAALAVRPPGADTRGGGPPPHTHPHPHAHTHTPTHTKARPGAPPVHGQARRGRRGRGP